MKVVIIIVVAAILARFAFCEANRQKRKIRTKNPPDFTSLKLDEDKIKDRTKF